MTELSKLPKVAKQKPGKIFWVFNFRHISSLLAS
jgi:hypothetical protein